MLYTIYLLACALYIFANFPFKPINSVKVPISPILPFSTKMILSAKETVESRCVIKKTVLLRAASVIDINSSFSEIGSRALDGSSRTTISYSWAKTLAKANFCNSPP